jgi:hypothetical protein
MQTEWHCESNAGLHSPLSYFVSEKAWNKIIRIVWISRHASNKLIIHSRGSLQNE